MIPNDVVLIWLVALTLAVGVSALFFWGVVCQIQNEVNDSRSEIYRLDRDATYERARYERYMNTTERLSSSMAPLTPLMDHLGLKWVPASQSPGRIEKKTASNKKECRYIIKEGR